MLFKWFARGLLIAAYVAVCLYAVGVETGPIGWINYAQQSVLGSYSQKLTMLIGIIASLVVLAPLWWAIDAFGGRLGVPDVLPGPARLAEPPQPPKAKSLLLSSFVAIPLIWIGGYAIWWYQQHQHQQDAAAIYEPLRLERGRPASAPAGAYLAVSGRLLWERVVTLTKGSSTIEYTLVPLVAEGWRDHDPVPYVVRVDNANRHLAERATRNREAVFGHAEGAVAVPAAQEFLKMQVPVSDATRQFRLVPSERGAPSAPDSAGGLPDLHLARRRLQRLLHLHRAGDHRCQRQPSAQAAQGRAQAGRALSAASCSGVPTFSHRPRQTSAPIRRSRMPA